MRVIQLSSVAQPCPTLCDPMNRTRQASLSITNSRSLLKLMPIEAVMPSNHLILCRSLLLLPPIPPSIRVFSSESTLHEVAKALEFQLQHQSGVYISLNMVNKCYMDNSRTRFCNNYRI